MDLEKDSPSPVNNSFNLNINDMVGEAEHKAAPEGGYGWVCVAASFLINAHTWGMNSSYGVFLAHYLSTNSYPGATSLQFAFVGGLSIAIAMFVSPLATYLVGRFSTRTTLLIGVVFETAAFLGASWATKIWQLFLSQGVCFGIGMGLLFVGSVPIVSQWFTKRRSFANAISAAGSGFGGLVYSLAAGSLIEKFGIGWTFRALGIIAFVVNTVCAMLLKDRNKDIGARVVPFDIKLFKKIEFWMLQFFGIFSMLGYVVLLFSIPNYANHIGLSAKQASIVGAMLNLGQGIGRPPIGYFSDRLGRINMSMGMSFVSGLLALAVWINAKSYGVLILYAILGGTVIGVYWATISVVTAEILGLKELPAALSITWIMITLPTLFSEPIGLTIVAANHGSYVGAQIFCGFMYMGAVACLGYLRWWKIADDNKRNNLNTNIQKICKGKGLLTWRKV